MPERTKQVARYLDADTVQGTHGSGAAMAVEQRLPLLTILYHHDTSRIGERIFLSELAEPGGRVGLSRKTPDFGPPPSSGHQRFPLPLGSPYISRKPIQLIRKDDGGLIFDLSKTSTPARLEREAIGSAAEIDHDLLRHGVVLDLAGRVLLLVHEAIVAIDAPPPRHGLVGESEVMIAVRHQISRVAKSDAPVLIRGDTGTGKELVARAVHDASDRASGPFLALNMAAVPSTMAASELFGHVRGAFSGAANKRDGYFAGADGGTLFMDEIGDTPLDVQAALLRVLETGEVQQLGAERPRKVDTRLVAATDADLEQAIKAGTFRAPLIYRLANREVRLPPLRERSDDVPRLLMHFLRDALEELGEDDLLSDGLDDGQAWLSASVVYKLVRYEWPGNVRQLRNVAHYLAGLSDRRQPLSSRDPGLRRLMSTQPVAEEARRGHASIKGLNRETLLPGDKEAKPKKKKVKPPREISNDEVLAVMEKVDYRLGPAAKELGISRPAFNALVDEHPSLKRANNLSTQEILHAREQLPDGQALWRALRVSKRGLTLRMRALGLE